MSGPKFNGQISLGNVISIVMIAIAGVAGWIRIESAVGANAVEINRHAEELQTLEAGQSQSEARIRALENTAARADERLSIILTTLARIEARIERQNPR